VKLTNVSVRKQIQQKRCGTCRQLFDVTETELAEEDKTSTRAGILMATTSMSVHVQQQRRSNSAP